MTFASGKIFDGEWVNDSFISRLESDIFYGVESDILRDKLLKDWADMRKVTINKLAESNMAPNMSHSHRGDGWTTFEVKNLINDLKKNQKHVIIDNMFIHEIVKIKNNMSDTSRINRAENLINARIRQVNGEKVEFGGLEDLLGHVLQSDINSIYIKANDMMEHTGGKKRTNSRKLKNPKRTNKKRKYNRKLRTRSKI